MWEYNYNYLSHHGISGQKWGVRRYQNEDGSLTAAGRKHYNRLEYKQAKKDYSNKYNEYYKAQKELIPNKTKIKKAYNEKNESLTKAKLIKDRNNLENNKNNKKSKRTLQLEEEYRNSGMSEKDAEMAAYKRQRTEKILIGMAVAGTLTVAALAAYKYRQENVDKIIKAGTTLQNISGNSNKGVEDAFYFSFNKADNQKYKGFYGKTLKDRGKNVIQTTIKVNDNLNVASNKSALKALQELSKDDNFKNSLAKQMELENRKFGGTPKQSRVIEKGLASLRKGKVDQNVYSAFNTMLVNHDTESQALNDKFFAKLRSKGYDAIGDLNDKKFSGYGAKAPMISFAGSGKLSVDKHLSLHPDEIETANRKVMGKEIAKVFAKSTIAQIAGISAATIGINELNNNNIVKKNSNKVISEYKKEHPNTGLSDREILYNYYGISS